MSEHDPLRDELDRLPREIAPSRDLWPGIEARIRPHAETGPTASEAGPAADIPGSVPGDNDIARRSWRAWPTEAVAAAAAIVVFLAGWGVAKLGPGLGGPALERNIDPVVSTVDDPGPDYQAAQQALLATLESAGIAPETAALIRRDLASMDDAVNAYRTALATRPNDARLQRQLTTEVRRRQHVLRRIAGIQIAGLQLGGNE